jgi:hypothetical protein
MSTAMHKADSFTSRLRGALLSFKPAGPGRHALPGKILHLFRHARHGRRNPSRAMP